MYDLIEDMYPKAQDKKVLSLEQMELDSRKRHEILQRRDDVYAELQHVLSEDTLNAKKLNEVEHRLEMLKHLIYA